MSVKKSQKKYKVNLEKYFDDNYPNVKKIQQDTFIALNKNIFYDFFQYTYGQLNEVEQNTGVALEGWVVEKPLFWGQINFNGKQVLISIEKHKLIAKKKKAIIKLVGFVLLLLFDILAFLLSAGKSTGESTVSGDSMAFIKIGINKEDFRNEKSEKLFVDKKHIFLIKPLKINLVMMHKSSLIKTFMQIDEMINFMTDVLQ